MKIFLTFITLFCLTYTLQAQETISIPDTLQGTDVSWSGGLNGSQASYSNWASGGVNNIAATGFSVFTVSYKNGPFGYGFLINTRYGKTKIQDEGARKIDDLLAIRNRFLYDLNNRVWKLFGNLNFKTQFDNGYNYGGGPDGEDLLISSFMAPGYLTHSLGLTYQPSDQFFVDAGFGGEHVFVRDQVLSTRYGLDEGDTYRFEAGLTFGAGLDQTLATNVELSSNLEGFWALNKPIKSTDLLLSNQITGRINNFMNASLKLDFAYNDDFSSELQVAQILSLGISFVLL